MTLEEMLKQNVGEVSAAKQRHDNPEERLQMDCVKWFRYQYMTHWRQLFAVPNGGSRNKKEAANMKAKLLIILNSEDLSKGLITVKDNVTKVENKVPEDEIIDYILGMI